MKYLFYLVIILMTGACNAYKTTAEKNTIPACIQQKIEAIKNEPKWNPSGEIQQYEYLGKMVYVISAPCCDFYISAVDENCNPVCAPSGGITGKGDGKCPDFYTQAKFVKTVWKDER